MAREAPAREVLAREVLAREVLEGLVGTGPRRKALTLEASLANLFPEGGLERGSTVAIAPGPGATSLALALLSGPSASGSWCAVVGVPDLGIVAAASCGIDLSRLALVPFPGSKWAAVAGALVDGIDVVVLRPPSTASQAEARKLQARARERGAVLVVLSCPEWPGRPEVRLEVSSWSWRGLGEGFGYLAGHELEIVVSGRGAASRRRCGRLCLGEPLGSGAEVRSRAAARDAGVTTASSSLADGTGPTVLAPGAGTRLSPAPTTTGRRQLVSA